VSAQGRRPGSGVLLVEVTGGRAAHADRGDDLAVDGDRHTAREEERAGDAAQGRAIAADPAGQHGGGLAEGDHGERLAPGGLGGLRAGPVALELVTRAPRTRFAVLTAVFLALVLAAPSFAWCAIPLFFVGLLQLPPRAVWPLVALLTAAVIIAQVRLAGRFDPSLVLGPAGVAVITAAVFLELDRQNRARRRALDELLAAREELDRSQRETGALAERARLSREIHDTLAQGLSSMNLLLQAADREWAAHPDHAREHVRAAAAAARENLAEARRFVRGLAPPALDDATLTDALSRLCAATERDTGTTVRFTVTGAALLMDMDYEVTLLRVAQSALVLFALFALGACAPTATEDTMTAGRNLLRKDGVDALQHARDRGHAEIAAILSR
jgi:hypothetical protein